MADAVPLNLKIIGMVVGTAILIGTFTAFQVYWAMEQESSRQLREMSRSIARELAARSQEYILLNDMFGLTRMLKDAVKNLPDLRYAFVVSPNKEVLAHTFEGGFPMDLLKVEHFVILLVIFAAFLIFSPDVFANDEAVINTLMEQMKTIQARLSERDSALQQLIEETSTLKNALAKKDAEIREMKETMAQLGGQYTAMQPGTRRHFLQGSKPNFSKTTSFACAGMLVDCNWLGKHISDPGLKIKDGQMSVS